MNDVQHEMWLIGWLIMLSFPVLAGLFMLVLRFAPKAHYKVTLGEFAGQRGHLPGITEWVYVIHERWPADAVDEAKRRHGRHCFTLNVEV